MDQKYVVFKREEFDEWYNEVPEADFPPFIEDAVVIRRQDKFAPPALDAYANAIQCVLEMVGDGVKMEIDKYTRLQSIADYFHDQAAKAWAEQRKLPD